MALDRKAAMAKSKGSVASQINNRFERVKEAKQEHPQGLLREQSESKATVSDNDVPDKATEQILFIPIQNVLDNPVNARQIYDENIVKLRAASIATHGQLEPAKVIKVKGRPGFYYLMDGHYRKRGLLAAGKTEMKCILMSVSSELELYRLSYLLNEERSPQSSLDNALAWKKLSETNLVKTDDDIAELVGMSKASVSKTLSLLSLPEPALLRMQEKPEAFGTTIAYEIVLIYRLNQNDKEILALIDRVIEEGISRRELQDIREKIESSSSSKKQRNVSRQHKIVFDGVEQGRIKEWDSGRLQLDVVIDDPKVRREILAELKKRFQIND